MRLSYKVHNIMTKAMVSSTRVRHLSSQTFKVGDKVPGFDLFKDQEPLVWKEMEEYPGWVHKLHMPHTPLAKLRKMELEEASDSEMFRYIKLTRRIEIKEANLNAGEK